MWYIVRHPETIWNFERRYQGWKDISLSEKGLRQKEALIPFLVKLDIDTVVSSDSLRCLMIAEEVAKKKDIPLIVSDQIRELNFGKWEGLTFEEITKIDCKHQQNWIDNPFEICPPDGESLNDCIHRMYTFLDKFKEGDILLVTHGGIIGSIFYYWLNQKFWDYTPKLGSCVQVDIKNKSWKKLYEPDSIGE